MGEVRGGRGAAARSATPPQRKQGAVAAPEQGDPPPAHAEEPRGPRHEDGESEACPKQQAAEPRQEHASDASAPRQPGEGFIRPLFPRYISEAGATHLRTFKTSTCDNSLMYRYALSPLADRLASLLPRTVAPNLITVLGLVPTISAHLLVLFYCPDLQQQVPSWVWAYVAFCTFAYQTIDNMDGKQARRTGTSSPLGMLIDHGVDALNVTFTGMNLIALFQLGGDWPRAALVWLGGALPFFLLTWEEFYTGTLYLPIVNGPTDGVLILVVVFLVSASVEDYTKFWSLPVPGGGGASITDCVLLFFWLCVFGNIAASFLTVERFHHGGGRGGSHGGGGAPPPSSAGTRPAATRRGRFRDAVAALVPFFAGAAASALWMSRSRVFDTHPRCVFWLLGLVFSKLVTHLQVAHICGEAYRPWRKTLILPLLLTTANKALFRSPPVDEAVLLVGCVGAALLSWSHMFCSVVSEMAAALEIRVFSLQPPKKAR